MKFSALIFGTVSVWFVCWDWIRLVCVFLSLFQLIQCEHLHSIILWRVLLDEHELLVRSQSGAALGLSQRCAVVPIVEHLSSHSISVPIRSLLHHMNFERRWSVVESVSHCVSFGSLRAISLVS